MPLCLNNGRSARGAGNANDTMPHPTYVTPTLNATFEPLDERLLTSPAENTETAFVLTAAVQERVQVIKSGVVQQRALAPADAAALMRSHAREFVKNGQRDKANMALIVAARAESRATYLLVRGD